MTDESSTSVLLAVTRSELATARQALAASQADLTRVEREAESLRTEVAVLRNSESLDLVRAKKERDLARAELATATAELEQLRAARSWRVARNNDTPCGACGRLIRRGEAVEPMPGTTKGTWQHCLCPDPEES